MRTDTQPHQQEKEKRNTGTPAGQVEEGQVHQQAKEKRGTGISAGQGGHR
jgi:hypothetical protein